MPDVHGCLDELETLLGKVHSSDDDRLIFLGDLVDRGPKSAPVVQLVRTVCGRNPQSTVLLGNHEVKLLRGQARQGKGKPGSLPPYASSLTGKDWEFLRGLPVYARDRSRGLVLVHGGFFPRFFSLLPAGALAESAPNLGSLSRRDADRYRCLTMVRNVDASGNSIGGATTDNARFWAEVYEGREGTAIFGHVPFLDGPRVYPHALGLDTGCVFGGRLTAAIFEETTVGASPAFVSVDAMQPYADISGESGDADSFE